MDFVDTLHSLEDALYEAIMWVVLLPKTLVKVLLRPGWIQPYVTAEWKKDPGKRFEGFLSPMIFWFILGILPYAVWNPNLNGRSAQHVSFAEPVQTTFLLNAFLLVIFPTYYAIVLQRLNGEPVERTAVKRLFYIQCYVHAPIALFSLPLVLLSWSFLSETLANVPASALSVNPNLLLVYLALMGVWVVLVQSVIIRAELKTGAWRALGLSLVYSLIGLVVMLVLVCTISVLALLL